MRIMKSRAHAFIVLAGLVRAPLFVSENPSDFRPNTNPSLDVHFTTPCNKYMHSLHLHKGEARGKNWQVIAAYRGSVQARRLAAGPLEGGAFNSFLAPRNHISGCQYIWGTLHYEWRNI